MKTWDQVKAQARFKKEWPRFQSYICDTIRRRRIELALTQEELAQKAGVAQPAISNIERYGRVPRLDTLYKIIRALGMNLTLIDYN